MGCVGSLIKKKKECGMKINLLCLTVKSSRNVIFFTVFSLSFQTNLYDDDDDDGGQQSICETLI